MSNIVVEVLFNLADVAALYEQLDNLIAANEINATVGSLTMCGEIRFWYFEKISLRLIPLITVFLGTYLNI